MGFVRNLVTCFARSDAQQVECILAQTIVLGKMTAKDRLAGLRQLATYDDFLPE
jgi:hypothetical protein